jgi:hypothetical protein
LLARRNGKLNQSPPYSREVILRLIQFRDGNSRGVARIEGDDAHVIASVSSMADLAHAAHETGTSIEAEAKRRVSPAVHSYRKMLDRGDVLNPVDHKDPAHCIITGTGLTHLGSAAARDEMHKKAAAATGNETDSIKMFNLGLKGGKPQGNGPGVQPEWFYKGDGSMLAPPGGDLPLPEYALDGGEEPEIAGLYVIGKDGSVLRLGFALGNEYSDHVTERQNYLYLAHSKLRGCAIGPELRTGPLPEHLSGQSRILRQGKVAWEKPFVTGEGNMSHTIANLEYHHFKYDIFRRPGDVHVHFFGTATLSVSDGFKTQAGDVFEIEMKEFGAPLRNRLTPKPAPFRYGGVKAL